VARKFPSKKKATGARKNPAWGVIGVDLSMTSISGAMILHDEMLGKVKGPSLHCVRWTRDVHWFERMAAVSRAENFIHDLMSGIPGCVVELDRLFIGVEEPWPLGMVKRMESGWLKQQSQIHGAFMGGLLRYGYRNIFEVNNMAWKSPVARDLGVKITKDFKWRVPAWAIEAYGVPEYPDLIESSKGLVPRPEESRAKAKQPDDRYDALGIMNWMENEILSGSVVML
jgi:hypothetical protein